MDTLIQKIFTVLSGDIQRKISDAQELREYAGKLGRPFTICFEGLDKTGKTTTSKKFYKYLVDNGVPVHYYKFPTSSMYNTLVSGNIDHLRRTCLFLVDAIRPMPELSNTDNPSVIIYDRHPFYSTIAYNFDMLKQNEIIVVVKLMSEIAVMIENRIDCVMIFRNSPFAEENLVDTKSMSEINAKYSALMADSTTGYTTIYDYIRNAYGIDLKYNNISKLLLFSLGVTFYAQKTGEIPVELLATL